MKLRGSRRPEQDSTWEVALRILRYLHENSNAADTVEGILEWWLPEQSIYEERKVVERALDEMVKRNLILTIQSSDARRHYRLNTDCVQEIRRLIRDVEDS
jgi:hypothetical protein